MPASRSAYEARGAAFAKSHKDDLEASKRNAATNGLADKCSFDAIINKHGLSNDPGYDEIDGHTLYSTSLPPGPRWRHVPAVS